MWDITNAGVPPWASDFTAQWSIHLISSNDSCIDKHITLSAFYWGTAGHPAWKCLRDRWRFSRTGAPGQPLMSKTVLSPAIANEAGDHNRPSVDGHHVRAISQQRLELGISYSVYRLIFMRGCANFTFHRTLTFDLATVTLILKILSARFLRNGLS